MLDIVILLVIFILLVLLIYQQPRHCIFEDIKGSINKKTQIAIIAIVKNEEMVIEEWLNHYRWQGIDHFYIIENGSEDKTYSILSSQQDVTIFSGNKRMQTQYYNAVFKKIKNVTDWIIVVDSDEYIYGRNGLKIKDYLLSIPYDAVILNWKMFTSNGLVKQPESIRKSFIRRRTKLNVCDKNEKTIVRTKAVKTLGIHIHSFVGTSITDPEELALNHYAIMSLEYFQKIKMTRGDATGANNVRTMEYFHKYDQGDTYDNELRDLVITHEQNTSP